jgi:hypothetical protein
VTRTFVVGEHELRALREQNVAGCMTGRFDDRFGLGVTEQAPAECDQRAQPFLRVADDLHCWRRDRVGERRACGERGIDDRAHGLVIERLGQRALHAERARHLAYFALVVGRRTEDDGGVRRAIVLAQPADELVAVHARHDDIGDQEVGLLGAQQVQRFHAVGCFEQAVVAASEQ